MENQKKFFVRKKAVVTAALLAVIVAVGGYASLQVKTDFFRKSAAIAVQSFRNVLVPDVPESVISEVDLSSSSVSDAVGRESVVPPSAVVALPVKNDGIAVFGDTAARGEKKETAPSTSVIVDAPASSTVVSEIPSLAEGSSTSIFADGAGGEDVASVSSSAAGSRPLECSFPVSVPSIVSRRVILNEVAWMGLPSSTGVSALRAADGEWMELKNISSDRISLDGWRVVDSAEKIKISFGSGDGIPPNGLYLVSRGGDPVEGVSADKAYAGILPNTGDKLAVLDAGCEVSDLLDASAKWPGGSNTTKQTLERKADLAWQTSALPGGTPRAENSAGALVFVKASSTEKYEVSVAIAGDGGGKVTIKPGTTVCKTTCTNEYGAGTTVTLAASPVTGVDFAGWSGGCSGFSDCSFLVAGPVSVVAEFRVSSDEALTEDSDVDASDENGETPIDAGLSSPQTTSTSDSSSSAAAENGSLAQASTSAPIDVPTSSPPLAAPAVGHLVIAAVQIAGATSNDDFVKMYNPTGLAVDISGWKLRKRSSTGTDSSLREFPNGSTVPAGGYFIWASSANGFAQSIGADASSTGTLAANNSVALFDESGAQVDAVAWGTGTGQYAEGAAYPDSPLANHVLARKFAHGEVVDTDNNSNDFTL